MNHLGPASPSNPDPLAIVRASDSRLEGCHPPNHCRGNSPRVLRSFRRLLSPLSPALRADGKTRRSAWTLAIVRPCCGAGLAHLLGIFSGGTAHTRECDAVEKPLRRKGYRSRPGNGSPAQDTNTISNGIAPYTRNYISKSSARSKPKLCPTRPDSPRTLGHRPQCQGRLWHRDCGRRRTHRLALQLMSHSSPAGG